MKNTQKGSASLWIIIAIIVLGAGGYLYYSKNKTQPQIDTAANVADNSDATDNPTVTDGGNNRQAPVLNPCDLLTLSEAQSAGIKAEVAEVSKDIKNNCDYRKSGPYSTSMVVVSIITTSADKVPQAMRDDYISLYPKGYVSLQGIGDVATAVTVTSSPDDKDGNVELVFVKGAIAINVGVLYGPDYNNRTPLNAADALTEAESAAKIVAGKLN